MPTIVPEFLTCWYVRSYKILTINQRLSKRASPSFGLRLLGSQPQVVTPRGPKYLVFEVPGPKTIRGMFFGITKSETEYLAFRGRIVCITVKAGGYCI